MILDYENTLRRLIISIVGAGDDAPYKVTESRLDKWKEKRIEESKKKNDLNAENRILYYSDFYDLGNIVSKNWDLFSKVLTDKKRFEVFYKEIESYRNTLAHGRSITTAEENLLRGITSDLKKSIAVYHNKNEMKEDYYIQLVRISDNLGNIWESGRFTDYITLREDDEYELIVEAYDPKAREIEYEIFTSFKDFNIKQSSNRFNFRIEKKLVSQYTKIYVEVRTLDSEYKNQAVNGIDLIVLPNCPES